MNSVRLAAIISSLIFSTLSGSALAKFQVTAFEGGPGFKAIQEADYSLALKRTKRSVAASTSLGFEASGNHCVAQLFAADAESAVLACNTALRAIGNDSAIMYYQQTYKVDQSRSTLFSNRGVAHAFDGDLEAAQKDFERALSLDPNNAQAKDNLQHLLKKTAAK